MKKFCAFILLFVFILNIQAAPLIFKTQKQIDSLETFVEIATVDTVKYNKIRIGINSNNTAYTQEVMIEAVEENEIYTLSRSEERYTSKTFTFDIPPSKIRVMVKGKGLYKIRVWGTQ